MIASGRVRVVGQRARPPAGFWLDVRVRVELGEPGVDRLDGLVTQCGPSGRSQRTTPTDWSKQSATTIVRRSARTPCTPASNRRRPGPRRRASGSTVTSTRPRRVLSQTRKGDLENTRDAATQFSGRGDDRVRPAPVAAAAHTAASARDRGTRATCPSPGNEGQGHPKPVTEGLGGEIRSGDSPAALSGVRSSRESNECCLVSERPTRS